MPGYVGKRVSGSRTTCYRAASLALSCDRTALLPAEDGDCEGPWSL